MLSTSCSAGSRSRTECARSVALIRCPRRDLGLNPSISAPVGFRNSAIGPDLGIYAAGSYSLMGPPRTGQPLICSCDRSATGWSGRGAGAVDCDGAASVRTVSNDAVNCPARSRTRKRKSAAITQIHYLVADLLHGPRPVRVRGDPDDVYVTAANLHDKQAVQAPEGHRAVPHPQLCQQEPDQCGEDRGRPSPAGASDEAAKHGDLVPQHEQLHVLGGR